MSWFFISGASYLSIYPKSSMFKFLRNYSMFSIDAVPFYSPDSKMQEFQFLHILASICYFLIFFLIESPLTHMKGYLNVV